MLFFVAFFSVLALYFALIAFLLSPGRKRKLFLLSGPKYYAHRGLYSDDQKVPENSLEAFSAAADKGYGIELDVQLTRDGKIVVFHDDDLSRCTGLTGRIGDYSFTALRDGTSLFDSDEKIPLFSDVLGLVSGRVPLIVEIKACPEWRELCGSVLSVLEDYSGLYCVESFDPRIIGWFRIQAPEIIRGQLSEQLRHISRDFNPVLRFSESRLLGNFISRPDFIAYRIGKRSFLADMACNMASCRVGWTLDPSIKREQAADFDILIFEHTDPEKQLSE